MLGVKIFIFIKISANTVIDIGKYFIINDISLFHNENCRIPDTKYDVCDYYYGS